MESDGAHAQGSFLFSDLSSPTPAVASMLSVRIGRRRTRVKSFRLISGRHSMHRVHVKFFNFLQVMRSVKSVYRRVMAAVLRKEQSVDVSNRQKYCARRWESNVFFADAIADCLEFIKLSASLQVEPDMTDKHVH